MKRVIIKNLEGKKTHEAIFKDPTKWIAEQKASNSWGKPDRWINEEQATEVEKLGTSREIDLEGEVRKEYFVAQNFSVETLDITAEVEAEKAAKVAKRQRLKMIKAKIKALSNEDPYKEVFQEVFKYIKEE